MNQVLLVGRITNNIKIQETEENTKYIVVRLSVPRSFKNSEGVYDNDYVNVKFTGQIAEQCSSYIEKGDMIGVKGRLSAIKDDKIEVFAEKVTFLSNKRK
jgi:single-strand DNA-binding protein